MLERAAAARSAASQFAGAESPELAPLLRGCQSSAASGNGVTFAVRDHPGTGKDDPTRDARTRDRHAARDGQRRRLDDAFDGGIMRPGDGGLEESVNCRRVLTTEIFDSEAELQSWLDGGS
jgi:hypothetical protein